MGMKWIEGNGYMPVAGHLFHILSQLPYFHDSELRFSVVDGDTTNQTSILTTPLIIPPSPTGPAILYRILEHPVLLDSSNMSMQDWALIASEVETWYDSFDGFVVIHGTDTMAYTASALSFLLESLGKPVVITGSQIPFSELRSDATDNLLGAMLLAAHFPEIREVCVYFGHKLFRGNRVSKISNDALHAFESLNCGHLAEVGVRIRVHYDLLKDYAYCGVSSMIRSNLLVHRHLDPNVAVLRVFPGISADAFRALLAPPIRGVVLATFGTGNMPNNRPDLLAALQDALNRGVIVVNVSQCPRGIVPPSGYYATGRFLDTMGVVAGSDMTVECALAKLSFLLSFPDLSPDEVKKQLGQSLRGELTEPHRALLSASAVTAVIGDDPDSLRALLNIGLQSELARMRPVPVVAGFSLLHLARYLGRADCAQIIEQAAPILGQIRDASGRLASDLDNLGLVHSDT